MADPFALDGLIAGGWKTMTFQPFRGGVEICPIVEGEPAVALLRYAPGAAVPRHRHLGLETIVVLKGSQRDERGVYRAGAVCLNPAGSIHSVTSDDGCVVLIQWTRPVEFVED